MRSAQDHRLMYARTTGLCMMETLVRTFLLSLIFISTAFAEAEVIYIGDVCYRAVLKGYE